MVSRGAGTVGVLVALLLLLSTEAFVLKAVAAAPHDSKTKVDLPLYGGIAHAGLLCTNTDESKDFYLRVLGFTDDTHLRPNLPFPGAFVRGGAQQIHLMELPNPDPTSGRPQHGGRDRHVAFTIANIDPLVERLKQFDHPFTMSMSGRRAVFTRDPSGNALEFMEEIIPPAAAKEGSRTDL